MHKSSNFLGTKHWTRSVLQVHRYPPCPFWNSPSKKWLHWGTVHSIGGGTLSLKNTLLILVFIINFLLMQNIWISPWPKSVLNTFALKLKDCNARYHYSVLTQIQEIQNFLVVKKKKKLASLKDTLARNSGQMFHPWIQYMCLFCEITK